MKKMTIQIPRNFSSQEIFDYLFEDLIYHAIKMQKKNVQAEKLFKDVAALEEKNAPHEEIIQAIRKAHQKDKEYQSYYSIMDREFLLLGGTADLWLEMVNRCAEEADKHAEIAGCESPCNGLCPD